MQQHLRQHTFIYLAAIWLLINLFMVNGTAVLWDEDEAAYAGFAKTMVETGDWAVPEFLWSEPHRKPPLHFWSIAVSYSIFGVHEWATRLPSVLSFILLLLAVYFLGKRVLGEEKAFLASLVLGSTLLLPNLAKIAFTDTTLLLFETVAVLALLNFLKKPAWSWSLLFWGMVALGVLVKGPPILILTLGIGGFLLLFYQNRKVLIGLHPWFFLPLALLPLIIWGWYASQKDGGELVNFLVDWYFLKRISGEGHVYGPVSYTHLTLPTTPYV